ncbi:MAG: hypothetical protein VB120_00705 [Lachnospiraceae bacterium]|nr:hypothetical protein [Lachnospiraceae bacterium]
MQTSDIILIVIIALIGILALLYIYNRKNTEKLVHVQDMVKQNKMTVSMFVIDKKIQRPTPQNLNKTVFESLPRSAKIRKLPMIKAKIGPQIVTLITDKSIYNIITPKKTVKAEIAGMYIIGIVGVNLADKKNKTLKEKFSLWVNKDRNF